MNNLYSFLAILPIVSLLTISLWQGVKAGVYASLLITMALFFVWDSQFLALPASLIAALVDALSILMIVFGAILLYHTMEQKGYIDGIKNSLKGVHHDRGFQFFFLAFFLTAFFESVAGFGTPGAIVPLLLISMGFPAILSVSAVLLMDGLFAVTGAVGTPVTVGLAAQLPLSAEILADIYFYGACMVALAGLIILVFINHFLKENREKSGIYGWALYFSIMVPFMALSPFLLELTGVVASVIMAAAGYFFFFTDKKLPLKPWLPYGFLVVVLLLPKIVPPLAEFISFRWTLADLLGTEVSASLQPLRSPLVPFLLAAMVAAGNFKISVKPALAKTLSVFVVLFPTLAITRLMMASGTAMPSMVESLAALFVKSGRAYPLLSPFIGVLGAFITGSTTVSNVIFGPVQLNASTLLDFPKAVILALQLTGASLGNAVCLFNIIAAAAVAGISNYSDILKKNLWPVAGATAVAAVAGYVLAAFP